MTKPLVMERIGVAPRQGVLHRSRSTAPRGVRLPRGRRRSSANEVTCSRSDDVHGDFGSARHFRNRSRYGRRPALQRLWTSLGSKDGRPLPPLDNVVPPILARLLTITTGSVRSTIPVTNLFPWFANLFPWFTNLIPWLTNLIPWFTNLFPWFTNLFPWFTSALPIRGTVASALRRIRWHGFGMFLLPCLGHGRHSLRCLCAHSGW
mmetsp:Transcript_7237/g.19793  ORF Transcript_7237/g.19793 Transcript_7237/m.19793 type:complete len:206 (+) Transcript_7237:1258-1875(+)